MSAIELENVRYAYRVGHQRVPALRGISLRVESGEMVAIQGPSGSGKSTLLYLLGCMLKPEAGTIRVLGQDVSKMSPVELAYFRNHELGFVFQQFHLLPSADVLENILLPAHYPLEDGRADTGDVERKARALAERLGISNRLDHRPQQLSGGQQQRVAIARALIRDAKVILADEPTGNLDSVSSQETLKLLRELNREGKTVVIITHDSEVAAACDRVIWVRDGQVEDAGEIRPARVGPAVRSTFPKSLRRGLSWKALLRESAPRAFENLRRNRLRSFLTMLGVVAGVASVLAMLTLGSFTKEKILSSYARLGINTLEFYAYPNWRMHASDRVPNPFSSLSVRRDLTPLKTIFPEIHRISPVFQSWGHTAEHGGRSLDQISVLGVGADYFSIVGGGVVVGEPIRNYHIQHESSVCDIGYKVARELFQGQSPVGQVLQVTVKKTAFSCVVIGVNKPDTSGKDSRYVDLQVIVPYTFYQEAGFGYWNSRLHQIVVQVRPGADTQLTGKKIGAFFHMRYGDSGEFNASSDVDLIAQMRKFLNLFTLLLASIASISLIVGGMGITNMMLVSVNERFREIGLRKALGASDAAVRQLFFSEAILLCGGAGVIGLLIGFAAYQLLIYLGAQLIPKLSFQWVWNPTALIISFIAIVVTGILSGLGPAVKAEKLQVIEALRSE